MARSVQRLTSLQVMRLRDRGLYADGGGLYLQVRSDGAKSWVFRFRIHGKLRDMGLGSLRTVSLADARQHAVECRKLILEGNDPIAAREAKRASARLEAANAVTFKQCAEAYIEAHRAGWHNSKHAAQWSSTLETYAFPIFGSLPVQSIDTGLVIKALERIWNTKPETAGRLRGRIETVLEYASTCGYRTGENPARWRGHLKTAFPTKSKIRQVKHHAALPYVEIGLFMAALRKQKGVAARALEFLILTAARTSDVLGATWGEINLVSGVWTIPASRMKAKKEHRVPLSPRALVILTKVGSGRPDDYIFQGGKIGRPLSNMAMATLLKRMGRGDITVHGFRSTFRDWVAEQTDFSGEVAEMALAHTVANSVEAAYRRSDLFEKRRRLMNGWATFCGTNLTAEHNVLPLQQA